MQKVDTISASTWLCDLPILYLFVLLLIWKTDEVDDFWSSVKTPRAKINRGSQLFISRWLDTARLRHDGCCLKGRSRLRDFSSARWPSWSPRAHLTNLILCALCCNRAAPALCLSARSAWWLVCNYNLRLSLLFDFIRSQVASVTINFAVVFISGKRLTDFKEQRLLSQNSKMFWI